MKQVLTYIVLAILFISCDEAFVLDSNQVEERVTIEALVTDRPGYQYVAVKKSAGFYADGPTPRISDAVVTISDDAGNTYNFVHNPNNHPDSAGIYVPEIPFVGQIGRTYSLKVEAEGKVFEASDKLVDVIPVDSMSYRIDEEEQAEPEITDKFYEILVFATEPQDEKNFYLFKFFRNDSLLYDSETSIYISDDELLAENIDGVTGPLFYGKDDVAKIEVYSMSRNGFVFYNDLALLLNGDSGGMFGPIPSSPRTNLTNDALGFFQVSAVKDSEILIQ